MNNLEIIGCEKKDDAPARSSKILKLKRLENAFQFHLEDVQEAEPFFIEFDELTAATEAYVEQGPLSILDVIQRLEDIYSDFVGIQVDDYFFLVRQRWKHSRGLTVEKDGEINDFMKDATLDTINFLDFYLDVLAPGEVKPSFDHDENNLMTLSEARSRMKNVINQ